MPRRSQACKPTAPAPAVSCTEATEGACPSRGTHRGHWRGACPREGTQKVRERGRALEPCAGLRGPFCGSQRALELCGYQGPI